MIDEFAMIDNVSYFKVIGYEGSEAKILCVVGKHDAIFVLQ